MSRGRPCNVVKDDHGSKSETTTTQRLHEKVNERSINSTSQQKACAGGTKERESKRAVSLLRVLSFRQDTRFLDVLNRQRGI